MPNKAKGKSSAQYYKENPASKAKKAAYDKKNDKGKFVLFGSFPKDIDKKVVIWELVAKREPQITWQYTKNNTLKKENYDQTDAYCAALGYMKMKEIW